MELIVWTQLTNLKTTFAFFTAVTYWYFLGLKMTQLLWWVCISGLSFCLWFFLLVSRFTESWNHRMVEFRRELWRPSDLTPLLKQEHLEQAAQDHVQMAIKDLQGGDYITSLDNLVKCSIILTVKCFLMLKRELPVFQSVPLVSCPVTEHHWNEPDSVFTALPRLVFTKNHRTIKSCRLEKTSKII